MKELTMLNLRFTARVESTIQLGDFKGSALRGAWQSHLRTLNSGSESDPLYQQFYRETTNGTDRSPYSFRPP